MNFKDIYEEALKKYVFPAREQANVFVDKNLFFSKAFIYCLIMRKSDGLDGFFAWKYENDKFFKLKIMEELKLPDATSEESLVAIRDFLYSRVIEDGYVVHSTNSYYANIIVTNGFDAQKTQETTDKLISEIKSIFPSGFLKTDLNYLVSQTNERSGWFYERSPYWCLSYCNGPEWFVRLTNNGYRRRNYEDSKNFIGMIMEHYDCSTEETAKAFAFFDQYWNLLTSSTRCMVLVSTKSQDLRPSNEKVFCSQLSIQEQIDYLTRSYFLVSDSSSLVSFPPSEINVIDYDKVLSDYKTQKNNSSKHMM